MTDQQTSQNASGDQQPDIKELRQAAARAGELERELAASRRTNAFLKAGINPDDKKAAYFFKGYEGDLTTEAIQTEARELGLIQEPGESQQQQQQFQGQQRISQAVQQAQPIGQQDAEALLAEAAGQGPEALMRAVREAGIPINED